MLKNLSIFLTVFFSVSIAIAKEDVLFEADKVIHNQKGGYLDAIGNVQLSWQDYFISADRVRYFEKDNQGVAQGHVLLVEPDGTLLFSQKLSFSEDGQFGKIENLAIIFEDNSKLTARSANRTLSPNGLGLRNQMRHATYSPCNVCANKKEYPLWQISATKVNHYKNSKTIYYNNLLFEFFGVPVFYIPILSHPDPSVKRASGFLLPSPSYSSRLGFNIALPFTINLSPQTSLILTPFLTTREGGLLKVDWKHILTSGQYNFSGSIAHDYDKHPDNTKNWPKRLRGHAFSDGVFGVGKNGRVEYNAQWVSDNTYLDFFNIRGEKQLNSNLLLQWQDDVLFLSLENYYLKDLVNEISRPDLFILPFAQLEATPELFGGHAIVKASLLSLLRRKNQIDQLQLQMLTIPQVQEEDVFRLSGEIGWQDNWILPLGFWLNFYGSARYDFYQRINYRQGERTNATTNKPEADTSRFKVQSLTRILPLAMLEWRWPFTRTDDFATQIFEPVVQLIYAPYTSQRHPFPNEDSQDFYFSDSNVLSHQRFAGLDQWESGPRVNVGVEWSLYQSDAFTSSLLFGKIFRARKSPDFDPESGLADKDSDIVARWNLSFKNNAIKQAVRLDRKDGALRRYDADVDLVFGPLSLFTGYTFIETSNGTDNQEIHSGLGFRIGQYWRLYGETRYNIAQDRFIYNQGGLLYDDECFKLDFSIARRETQNEDNELKIGIRFSFRNLGSAQLSSGSAFNY